MEPVGGRAGGVWVGDAGASGANSISMAMGFIAIRGGVACDWRIRLVASSDNVLEPTHLVPVTTLPGAEAFPTLAPNGNYVAFTWSGLKQDNDDIYVQRLDSGAPLQLTKNPANDFSPAWSPDDHWIAFLRGQLSGKAELRLIPPLGGPERQLTDIRIAQGNPSPHTSRGSQTVAP